MKNIKGISIRRKLSFFIIAVFSMLLLFVNISCGIYSFGSKNNIEKKDSAALIETPPAEEFLSKESKSSIEQNNRSENLDDMKNDDSNNSQNQPQTPGYLELYEGLHVTGIPVEVDIESYRLKVYGEVEKELSFTFNEIKNMPYERIYAELNCPGFFTDEGYWTGVRIIDILNEAGLKENASEVLFTEIDGGYYSTLPLEKAKQEGYLIAYQFNGKEFSKFHGYPLRIVAKGEPGSVWVKWLGEIKLLN